MKWGKTTLPQESSEPKTQRGVAQKEITIIASGTVLSGDIEVLTDLQVMGEVKAGVTVSGCLTVASQGRIESQSILCSDAYVSGHIEGDITIAGTLSLRPGGVINGNVSAGSIIIEQGGRFCGQSRYLSEKESEQLQSRLSKGQAPAASESSSVQTPNKEKANRPTPQDSSSSSKEVSL